MNTPVLCIRPEPGLWETMARGQTLGLDMRAAPLFWVEPVAWTLPDTLDYDAILAGSANAFRHGGATLQSLTHLPVYAVGEATANCARQADFVVAQTGMGGLQQLVDANTGQPMRWLRLAGSDRVELVIPECHQLDEIVVYRAAACAIGADVQGWLGERPVVLLHSAGAAAHFAAECRRIGAECSQISLATLGPRIASAAGRGWRIVETAPEPTDAALLALTVSLCKRGH